MSQLSDNVSLAFSECNRLRKENEALRVALEPFVSWMNDTDATGSRRLEDKEYPPTYGMPRVADLRSARKALEAK